MNAGQGWVLAGDLGGSSLRAALISPDGVVLVAAATDAPVVDERGEIAPQAWWEGFRRLCGDLARTAPDPFRGVAAIAICGMTRTQVLLDRAGEVIRPALTWSDTRAHHEAAVLRERLPPGAPEREALNAFHPLARLAWLRAHEPDAADRIATVLDPKDFLAFRLTGRRASDPISLARLAAGRAHLPTLGLSDGLIPPLLDPSGTVGPVSAGLPAPFDQIAGAPVVCCSHDTWAAALGLGALEPGRAYNISGTTEVLGVLANRPLAAPGLVAVEWGGLHQLGGPSQNGADALRWWLEVVGRGEDGDASRRIDAVLDAPRQPEPLLFLPYLQGERAPHWDSALRGAFLGLNRRHGPTDMAWAVTEGVAFQNRLVLERAEAALGRPVDEIRMGGGAAANARWRQVKADVLGRPVLAGAAREPGLLGAAMAAWTAVGAYPSLAEAAAAMARPAHSHTPDPARAARYDRLFALFREAEAAVAPLSRALAGMVS